MLKIHVYIASSVYAFCYVIVTQHKHDRFIVGCNTLSSMEWNKNVFSQTLMPSFSLCGINMQRMVVFLAVLCSNWLQEITCAFVIHFYLILTGCGMCTLFVLVFPCFSENVVVTCKIGSFLCSLDNLLRKNVIVFFFRNQISKWRSFEKKGYFWPTFHIF